jgi:ABC-2 type transport system ATP-binding protein
MPKSTQQPGIVLTQVSKTFPKATKPAINTITAHIKPGQITGLVGPDGAGKTTLIRLMAALLNPTEGRIFLSGVDTLKNPQQIHTTTGYMPQKFGLYEELSVHENLTLYADIFGISLEERGKRFERLLSFTNLAPFQKRLAGQLSGGMKQKLGLACALLRKPAVLLLDEPSVGVDPISRRELWSIVRGMVDAQTTVVWSTSYLDEAEQCEEVLALNEGELIFAGPPQDLAQSVKKRVYISNELSKNKRGLLQDILTHEEILDGLIVGSHLKIILKDPGKTPPKVLKGVTWKPGNPTFEDGFITLLGGIQVRHSGIANLIHPVYYPENMPYVIRAQKLGKMFGSFRAAHQISFDVKPGEVFGILGPNGAGKSTTFKMLCGLLTPTVGDATILHHDLRKAGGLARAQIGYMAQKFSLYGNLTVGENLQFFSGIYGLKGSDQARAIQEMHETFHLDAYLNTQADELPLGFKQRLALSCSVMHRPKILFLDEPTSGVDPITRREFWLHINSMVKKGITVLVTTHFMDEAEYCDRLCLVYQGEIIALGTPDDLKAQATRPKEKPLTLEQTFIRMIEESPLNPALV